MQDHDDYRHHRDHSNNNNHNNSNHPTRIKRKKKKHRRRPTQPPIFSCFNILLILVFFETIALLSVGLFSNQLQLSEQHGPLMESLYNFGYDVVEGIWYHGGGYTGDDDLVQMEDQMVHETEQKLMMFSDHPPNQGKGPVPRQQMMLTDDDDYDPSSTKPLDNYFSRKRMPVNRQPIIVIGGTDGSGTRAFVPVLGKLGVPMIVDDQETMDVHGKVMFHEDGWPPLANMILNSTHSANYEFDSLPPEIQSAALEELGKLKKNMDRRYNKLIDRAKDQHMKLATSVSYGFKAPVTMLLLPLLRQVYGPIKYLHVVRDGRDVALSTNQSPVQKYYDSSFLDSSQRKQELEEWFHTHENEEPTAPQHDSNDPQNRNRPSKVTSVNVQAMQLWNDWNMDVLQYVRQHANGQDFSYMVVRTEDLLHPRKKFDALYQLGEFLGTPKKLKDLCCMSQTGLADMGRSSFMGPGPDGGGFGNGFPGRGFRRGGQGQRRGQGQGQGRRRGGSGGGGGYNQDFGMIRAYKQTDGESAEKLKQYVEKHHLSDGSGDNNSASNYEQLRADRQDRIRQIAQKVGKNLRQHNAKRNVFSRRRLDDSGAIDYIVNTGLWKEKQRHLPPPRQLQQFQENNDKEEISDADHPSSRRLHNKDDAHPNNHPRKKKKKKKHQGGRQEEWKDEQPLQDDRMLENDNNGSHNNKITTHESEGGGSDGRQHRRGNNNIREIAQKVHDGYLARGDALFQDDDGGGSGDSQHHQDKPPNPAGKKKKKKKGGGTGNSRRGNHGGRRSPPKRRQGGQGRIRIDRGLPVEKRYGKWMIALKDKPHMLKKLEGAGQEGLKAFGYEPKQRFLDYQELEYQCDDTVLCKA